MRVLVVLVALTSLACGSFGGSCEEACAEDGRCGRRTWAAGDGLYRCFPRDDADCEASRACREEGRCDYRPERALEACVAAEAASCRASEACAAEGRCRPDHTGTCRASHPGCVASLACAEEDRCEAYDDTCRVPSGDGPLCEAACRVEGACTELDGRCLATTAEDCRASHLCRHAGVCAVGPAGTCVAATDDDCAASSMCAWNGFCSAREGVCVEGLAVCEDPCREQGWCGTRDAVCEPRDDADCAASLACLVNGACARQEGTRAMCRPAGAADCAASLEGRAFGRTEHHRAGCSVPGGRPSLDARCFRDPACADEGRCLTAADGTCHRPEEYDLPPIPPARRPRARLPR